MLDDIRTRWITPFGPHTRPMDLNEEFGDIIISPQLNILFHGPMRTYKECPESWNIAGGDSLAACRSTLTPFYGLIYRKEGERDLQFSLFNVDDEYRSLKTFLTNAEEKGAFRTYGFQKNSIKEIVKSSTDKDFKTYGFSLKFNCLTHGWTRFSSVVRLKFFSKRQRDSWIIALEKAKNGWPVSVGDEEEQAVEEYAPPATPVFHEHITEDLIRRAASALRRAETRVRDWKVSDYDERRRPFGAVPTALRQAYDI